MSPVHKTQAPAGPPAAEDAAVPRVVSGLVVRTGGAGLSLRVPPRSVAVSVVLLAVLVTVMGISLTTGTSNSP